MRSQPASEILNSAVDNRKPQSIIQQLAKRLSFNRGLQMDKINHGMVLARALMDQHGLTNWVLKTDDAKRRFGCCDYNSRQISISRRHYLYSRDEDIKDTILHEIAHALVGPGHGHNRVWKAKCVEIGAKPLRCGKTASEAYNEDAKWFTECCGKKGFRYRKPRTGTYICRTCKKPIVWHQR